MPAVQTDYGDSLRPGLNGQIANSELTNTITRIASGNIGFGVVAVRGVSGDQSARLPSGAGQKQLGLTVKDTTLSHDVPDRYELGDNMTIMTRGLMWVVTATDVTPGDIVTFNTTTGAVGDTAVGAGFELLTGAEWETTALAGGLALVRLGRP